MILDWTGESQARENQKGRSETNSEPALCFAIAEQSTEFNPAVTYVPTQLPVQYHRLSEA
jgi:hypothetical protein